MENQHRKIKGYRELSQDEIDMINEIKENGISLDGIIERLNSYVDANQVSVDKRWLSIGKTHLQQGLMALTRAIAKPEFF